MIKHAQNGFTLLELMIVIAVVSILASLAYPSYQYAMRKVRRAEAQVALLQLMQQQERYYTLHTRYVAFSSASFNADEKKFKWYSGGQAKTSAYEISGAACAGGTIQDCIVLIARPGTAKVNSAFQDPECGVLSLSSNGLKSANRNGCW
jgi:type IV pilus assembly protein PilE